MLAGLVIVSLLFFAAALTAAWSFARYVAIRSERDLLSGRLQAAAAECESIKRERSELVTQLRDAFKALAGDALKENTAQFLQLAHKTLEGEQKDALAQLEQRKQAIEALIKPVRENLQNYSQSLQQSYGSLTAQLKLMAQDQDRLRKETANLVQALRRPEVRGRWGEIQLRRVAELAGMSAYCDFEEQVSTTTPDGRLRPDMVVRLPNQRCIIVDAKTPLEAYLSALECQDESLRQQYLSQHVAQIESKVRDLSGKGYTAQFATADFVVLFIPGECFLYAAADQRPDLWETALAKGVVIATPSTLIALLKIIALGWREQQLAENAEKISELGCELHERLVIALKHLAAVGGSLEKAVDAHNKFVGSLETRVLASARKFEELGAASANPLPDLKPVELLPRQPRVIEASPSEA